MLEEDAQPSTTLKGLKNRRNEPILAGSYNRDWIQLGAKRSWKICVLLDLCVDACVVYVIIH